MDQLNLISHDIGQRLILMPGKTNSDRSGWRCYFPQTEVSIVGTENPENRIYEIGSGETPHEAMTDYFGKLVGRTLIIRRPRGQDMIYAIGGTR